MFGASSQSFQVVDGQPKSIHEICLAHAIRTFLQREQTDTNPLIVRMVINGEPIDHWYYRADDYVDQPYFIASKWIQPLIGNPVEGFPLHYGEGTYEVDRDSMRLAQSEKGKQLYG